MFDKSIVVFGFCVALCSIVCIARGFLWIRRAKLASEWEGISTDRWLSWRTRNPGVYVGLSPEGIALVLDVINAYLNYVKVWHLKKDEDYIRMLECLLNEFPDPSPSEEPSDEQPPSTEAVFFVS